MCSKHIGWYALIIMIYSRVQGTATGDRLDEPCDPNFYRSEFFDGDCVACPTKVIHCKNEQAGDDTRCEMACGKALLTSTPAMVAHDTKESTTNTVVMSTTTTSESDTIENEITANPAIRRRKEPSNPGDKTIIVGVGCTVAALVVLMILFAIVYCKCQRKSKPDVEAKISHGSKSLYIPVTTNSNSNEDIKCPHQTNGTQAQGDGGSENMLNQFSSSSSILNDLEETDL